MTKARIAVIVLTLAAGLALGGTALADPEPGSNTGNSFVCNGNNADPPPCPGK